MKRLGIVIAAWALLAASVLNVSAATTASLGSHGAIRWTPGASVYLNLKAMTPGTWKVQLWSGTCAAPGLRLAVLPSAVVPASGKLTRTTKYTAAPDTSAGLVLRLLRAPAALCATLVGAPVVVATPSPSPTPSPTPTPVAASCDPGTLPIGQGTQVASLNGTVVLLNPNKVERWAQAVPDPAPEPGHVYVTVQIQITGPTGYTVTGYGLSVLHDLDIASAQSWPGKDVRLPALDWKIESGGITGGWVTFDVPAEAADALYLRGGNVIWCLF